MCDVCEKAADLVVAREANCSLTADEVREVVRAFKTAVNEIDEDAAAMDAVQALSQDAGAMIQEEAWQAAGQIPTQLLDLLMLAVGGPVVVVGARMPSALLINVAGVTREGAIELLKRGYEGFSDPLAETGGVTEDGKLVSGVVEYRRSPE